MALAGLAVGSASAASAPPRVVAVQGDAAPGTDAGFAELLSAPVINDAGQVAFLATLDDEDGTAGVFSEGDGLDALRRVALAGEPAPGGSGASFVDLPGPLFLNALGDVVFAATLDDGRAGLWTDRQRPGASVSAVAVAGDPAPGTLSRAFAFEPQIRSIGNTHSGVAFSSILTVAAPPENAPATGVFNEGFAVVLDTVAQTGTVAPGSRRAGTGEPGSFRQLGVPMISDTGDVVFKGETGLSGIGDLGFAGVWTTSPGGSLRGVALTGQPAPGTDRAFSTLFRGLPVLNAAGDVAFAATLTGLIDGQLREGIWVERAGVVEKAAVESEPALGTGSSFLSLSDPLLDALGGVVFTADLADGRDGLWRRAPGGVPEPIALQGDDAPDTGLGILNILRVAVNEAGQIAFTAQLDDLSSTGLFVTDAAGALRKVAATGDVIETAAGVLVVEELAFSGVLGDASLASGLAATGEVAFLASGPAAGDPFEAFLSAVVVSGVGAQPAMLQGDLNWDGFVGAGDLDILLGLWNQSVSGVKADLNGDGFIGAGDLDILLGNWNAGSPPAGGAAVPEPGSLAAAGAALLLTTRRRRR